jgi:ABC-type transport system substrate-binding protein
MKLKIVSLIVLAGLVLAFALIASSPAATNTTAGKAVTAATSQPGTTTADPREPHPQIRAAIAALRRAKEHMQHAAHDFGGHRVEALRATDEAIRQLETCLQYDKD